MTPRGAETDADVIVVGAGVAGCVVARRLADAGLGVLLLEAGPASPVPPAQTAAPLAGLAQLDRQWPGSDYVRGRGLGGGSAINGLVMMAGDTVDLRQFGGADLVAEMLRVTDELAPRPRSHGPLSMTFRRAARQIGHASAPSSANLDQAGLLTTALALDDSGRRSVAQLYLGSSAAVGQNLKIEGNTEVVGLVRRGQGATGVRAIQEDGEQEEVVFSARHVVLSMGALASPRLLLVEGVGNAHVGKGLKDHPAVPFVVELPHDPGDHPITTGLRWSSELGGGDLLALPMESIGESPNGVPLGMVLVMAIRVASEGRVNAGGVEFDHLAHPDDRLRMRAALRDTAALLEAADLGQRCSIDDIGTPLAELPSIEADLDRWAGDHLGGVFHAGCSCRFGSAVGPGGAVLGEPGISVIDASVLPDLPAGNPQLPVMAWASWLGDQLAADLKS